MSWLKAYAILLVAVLGSLPGVSAADPAEPMPIYYQLPEIEVEIGGGLYALKTVIDFEIGSADDVELLDGIRPFIVDHARTYLAERRLDEVQGSENIERVRRELQLRIKAVAGIADVRDLRFLSFNLSSKP
jgi:flagellar basal body-associated protein FliL